MSASNQDLLTSGGVRVTANDPYFVTLGGDRLTTAVTIHYIPMGYATIGSSSKCNIHINGSGVQSLHCTLHRHKESEVTIAPQNGALILIDGQAITKETDLFPGAMLTIGNSNYFRFNNSTAAEHIKPSLETAGFTTSSQMESENPTLSSLDQVFEFKKYPKQNNEVVCGKITELGYTNFNNFHSPKVFTSNSVTVNTPAKDVLGPKYSNFAKNLVENNIVCKNSYSKVNGINAVANNIPSNLNLNQKSPLHDEVLIKVNNSNNNVWSPTKPDFNTPEKYSDSSSLWFDRLSVNDLNSDDSRFPDIYIKSPLNNSKNNDVSQSSQSDELNEILKICSEYERQNQSLQSSPIVQNRIKTNGSLPKEKTSPFDVSQASFFPKQNSNCPFVHENLNMPCNRDVQIYKMDTKSDNHSARKFLPQSPRTKIRTICKSPKKELTNPLLHNLDIVECGSLGKFTKGSLKSEMKSTKCARHIESDLENGLDKNKSNNCPIRCPYKDQNVNELIVLNKSYPTGNTSIYEKNHNNSLKGESQVCFSLNEHLEKLKSDREGILSNIRSLKAQISEIQRQEEEILHEFDMEEALVSAEMSTMSMTLIEMEKQFSLLKTKIFRLEAQRNADRVMQEAQQAKLKQSIELKHERIASLEKQLQEENDLAITKLELNKEMESLETDRKYFEDLEFQYLEEEADWMAYKEELYRDLKKLLNQIGGKRSVLFHLYNQKFVVQNTAFKDTKTLESNLLILLTLLEKNREMLLGIERNICEISGQDLCQTESEDEDFPLYNIKNYEQETTNELIDQYKSFPLVDAVENAQSKHLIGNLNENIFVKASELPQKQIYNQLIKSENVSSNNVIEMLHNKTNFVRNQDNTFNIDHENVLDKDQLQYNIPIQSDIENSVDSTNLNNSLSRELYEGNKDQCKKQLNNNSPKGLVTTEGANSKIANSIKKIELNRQLLLSQGHDRMKYEKENSVEIENKNQRELESNQTYVNPMENKDLPENIEYNFNRSPSLCDYTKQNIQSSPNKQRLSHTKLESQKSKSLTEEDLKVSLKKQFKSTNDLSPGSSTVLYDNEECKRSSLESESTTEESCSININLPRHRRPLTRYLPNMSPDLDLKMHIESAGHQIALCPYVQIDSHSCRGYLHKLRATFHGWSRRWFVFDRSKSAFIYYCDKTEKKIRGGVYFSAIEEVYLDHLNASKSGRPNCTFVIKTKNRSFHLMAASDAAARIWIDSIITGAQGKVNY